MSEVVIQGKYKPYPVYKDSGVEWLGEVPEHWNLKRIKDTALLVNGFPFASNKFNPERGVPLVRIRDINLHNPNVFFDGDVPKEAIINNGDILIGMDGDFNVSYWNGGKAALNQRVACVRASHKVLQRFFYYLLPFNMKVVNDLTYFTTVKHLSSEDILRTIYALPSNNELSRIVSFLDQETGKIDLLIEKQQAMIALLKEKRQAVISHAVTKGLNPDAPMKESGIEWLGVIPEHWKVSKVKFEARFDGGSTPSKDKLEYWNGDIYWVSPKDMKSRYISSSIDCITQLGQQASNLRNIPEGSVLMVVRSGILQRTIPVAITKTKVTLNQDMKALSFKSGAMAEYFTLMVEGLTSQLLFEWRKQGATVESIEMEYLENSAMPIPPINEIQNIVDYLEAQTKKIDTLIDKSQQAIELLKERKTALISAAVTGKIDVREGFH